MVNIKDIKYLMKFFNASFNVELVESLAHSISFFNVMHI